MHIMRGSSSVTINVDVSTGQSATQPTGSRAYLKPPFDRFESLQGIEQLQPRFTHVVRMPTKLLSVSNRKSDPIDRDPSLIGHFELYGRRRRVRRILDSLKNFMHNI
jgi:hypothetical protein